MSETRCELSDLPVGECACRIHGPATGRDGSGDEPPRPFRAQFRGWCAGCEDQIEPGDMIVAAEGYLHEGCA